MKIGMVRKISLSQYNMLEIHVELEASDVSALDDKSFEDRIIGLRNIVKKVVDAELFMTGKIPDKEQIIEQRDRDNKIQKGLKEAIAKDLA